MKTILTLVTALALCGVAEAKINLPTKAQVLEFVDELYEAHVEGIESRVEELNDKVEALCTQLGADITALSVDVGVPPTSYDIAAYAQWEESLVAELQQVMEAEELSAEERASLEVSLSQMRETRAERAAAVVAAKNLVTAVIEEIEADPAACLENLKALAL